MSAASIFSVASPLVLVITVAHTATTMTDILDTLHGLAAIVKHLPDSVGKMGDLVLCYFYNIHSLLVFCRLVAVIVELGQHL